MSEFDLFIASPNGVEYDGKAETVIIRTSGGDMGILKNHIPYAAVLKCGKIKIKQNGEWKTAQSGSGAMSTDGQITRLAVSSFEWDK